MTATPNSMQTKNTVTHWIAGFAAGFIAVLLFHQVALWLLGTIGVTQAIPYSPRPVGPLQVPQFLSSAFWGGIWGMVFQFFARDWRPDMSYWIKSFAFGMIFPTLVAWFVVAPLKGLPLAAGGKFNGMLTGLLVNGAWGLGTGLLLRLWMQWRGR